MLDPKLLRSDLEQVAQRLARRGFMLDVSQFEALEVRRRDLQTETAHPIVRTHPETGRKALYIGSHTQSLDGFSQEEADPIIDFLREHSAKPEMTCRFRWAPGSMAIWDNRCTQHLALADYQGQRRRMHRITIAGDTPV